MVSITLALCMYNLIWSSQQPSGMRIFCPQHTDGKNRLRAVHFARTYILFPRLFLTPESSHSLCDTGQERPCTGLERPGWGCYLKQTYSMNKETGMERWGELWGCLRACFPAPEVPCSPRPASYHIWLPLYSLTEACFHHFPSLTEIMGTMPDEETWRRKGVLWSFLLHPVVCVQAPFRLLRSSCVSEGRGHPLPNTRTAALGADADCEDSQPVSLTTLIGPGREAGDRADPETQRKAVFPMVGDEFSCCLSLFPSLKWEQCSLLVDSMMCGRYTQHCKSKIIIIK